MATPGYKWNTDDARRPTRRDAKEREAVGNVWAADKRQALTNSSDQLRDSINAMFKRFEEEHRLGPGFGRVFLLDRGMSL
jgi:hypothetical protein